MNKIDSNSIDKIFSALDRQISVLGGWPLGLVVCGGTALAALGLVLLTTKDVDVLGLASDQDDKNLIIQSIAEFPEFLDQAAAKVGRDFILPEDWLNLGPAAQVESGLPDGFESRLVMRGFGKYLTVYFISRLDQIHFKLYAAVDRDDYHTDDLLKLKPTRGEIESAAKWVVTQDVSKPFKLGLKEFLRGHDYEDIANKI